VEKNAYFFGKLYRTNGGSQFGVILENLLYLVHRLPYPPNKGDKVRSFNILKYLSGRYNVFLGTFIDDPDDHAYVDVIRSMCAGLYVCELNPLYSKIKSLKGIVLNNSLSVNYYDNSDFASWVKKEIYNNNIKNVVVFSSVMATFVPEVKDLNVVVEFVDVDSAKWTSYASQHRWPMSWLYKREGEYLLSYERLVAKKAKYSFFVTDQEASLFRGLAPEVSEKIGYFNNGVDTDFFKINLESKSPFFDFHKNSEVLVFTGVMDYWPNIDAVIWFVKDVFPLLLKKFPSLCFYIVGRNPVPAVLNLASDSVVVTGTVTDVRPYLQYASAIVAPLRIARGIQNKILEAMAMSKVVVTSSACASVINAKLDKEILAAEDIIDFVEKISLVLNKKNVAQNIGECARICVETNYSWSAHLTGLENSLNNSLDNISE
jgi:sugar transferase (PEP-CTERM/EpsH1 system associated)